MNEIKSTYSLDIMTSTLCTKAKQVDIIRVVLENTLAIYQWHYQVTNNNQQNRDANSGAHLAVVKVTKLLRAKGENTLANDVEDTLEEDTDTAIFTRRQVLFKAKAHMKERLLDRGMPIDTYTNEFAVLIEEAFIEWCEQYPLAEAPAHFDSDFEPPIY